jgi:hypothetical protein
MAGAAGGAKTAGIPPSQDRIDVRHVTVLINIRGVLGGTVHELLKDAFGARAVGEVPRGVPLTYAVSRAQPRVVVIELGDEADSPAAPPILTRLLNEHPHLRVLVVEGDGRSGSLWELRPTRTRLGELSPELLIRTIDGRAGE